MNKGRLLMMAFLVAVLCVLLPTTALATSSDDVGLVVVYAYDANDNMLRSLPGVVANYNGTVYVDTDIDILDKDGIAYFTMDTEDDWFVLDQSTMTEYEELGVVEFEVEGYDDAVPAAYPTYGTHTLWYFDGNAEVASCEIEFLSREKGQGWYYIWDYNVYGLGDDYWLPMSITDSDGYIIGYVSYSDKAKVFSFVDVQDSSGGSDQPSGGNGGSGGDQPSGGNSGSGGNQPSGGNSGSGGSQPPSGGNSGGSSGGGSTGGGRNPIVEPGPGGGSGSGGGTTDPGNSGSSGSTGGDTGSTGSTGGDTGSSPTEPDDAQTPPDDKPSDSTPAAGDDKKDDEDKKKDDDDEDEDKDKDDDDDFLFGLSKNTVIYIGAGIGAAVIALVAVLVGVSSSKKKKARQQPWSSGASQQQGWGQNAQQGYQQQNYQQQNYQQNYQNYQQPPVQQAYIPPTAAFAQDPPPTQGLDQQAAQPSTRGYLICQGGELAGQSYPIPEAGLMVGRDGACDVQFSPTAPGVSRQHCRVYWQGDQLCLVDLGSSCGTFYGGVTKLTPNQPVVLQNGDSFAIAEQNNSFTVQM